MPFLCGIDDETSSSGVLAVRLNAKLKSKEVSFFQISSIYKDHVPWTVKGGLGQLGVKEE